MFHEVSEKGKKLCKQGAGCIKWYRMGAFTKAFATSNMITCSMPG
jgi:hypothetical protein